MTLQVFDFEGIDGATLSGTNVALQGSGSAVFSAAEAAVGGTGARFTATAGNARSARCTINAAKLQAIDVVLRTTTTPSSGTYALGTLRHASGLILTVEYNTLNGIGIFETAGATRNNVPSVTIANNTQFRIQLLVSIGVSTNDSSFTAKVFSAASGFVTQVGTTLTRSGINLGTVNAVAFDIGAITAATPGLVVGADYLRADDGKTTDFAAIPTASAPTAVAGASDQYPEVGTAVTLSASGSSGSGLTYVWTCTGFPPGASSPSISAPTSASPTFTPAAGGRYTFQLVVTSAGVTDTTTVVVYPHPASGDDVKVFSSTPGVWTNEGGATSITAAVNDASSTTFAQSVANPTGQKLRLVMNPYGPGSVIVYVSGLYTGGALNRTVDWYMADGTTLLQSDTFALTASEAEVPSSLGTGQLATASAGLNRRALVVDISDAP